MNGKKAKAVRRAAPPLVQRSDSARPTPPWRSWKVLATAISAALITASFAVPDLFTNDTIKPGASHAMSMGADHGRGLPIGSKVPAFREQDLLSGKTISSKTVYPQKTLLFFSEGVMCQACFEQIQGLQAVGSQLQSRGIRLVSITPDTPGDLRQAASQYGITTPLISDADRNMSDAFNTLGLGMHSDMPGHAFALIDKGRVLWYRDYWLPPDRVMYVPTKELLADIPS